MVLFSNCPLFFLLLRSSWNCRAYYFMMIPHTQLDSISSTKQTTCRKYVHNNKDGTALQRCLWSLFFFGAVISFYFLSALPFSLSFFLGTSYWAIRKHFTQRPRFFQHFYANNSHIAQDIFSIASNMELVLWCEEAEGAQLNSRNSDIDGGKQQKQ
jgi:hypothetical protein